MYAIKIMSGENMADSDVGKGFKMIMVDAGDTFEFGHDQNTGKPQVTVTGIRAGEPTCVTYPVTGNCYVLSETGKTIASFWGRSLWEQSKTLHVEVDAADPERTVEQVIHTYATGLSLAMQSKWEECGLSNNQILLLKNGPTELAKNRFERDNNRRARVCYLTDQGIPFEIAMDATEYMLGEVNL